jgi:hypothetical protein
MTTRAVVRRNAEKGAAATIVAILAAGGVLLGTLALSVDVGSMMFERRQLQNGADATAMALAQICAADPDACTETNAATMSTLTTLANANANASDGLQRLGSDGAASERSGLCGGNLPTGASLEPCDSLTSNADIADLNLCPARPGWLGPTIPYVETYTSSQSDTGPVLDFFFRSGNTSVTNCARSAWGSPGSFKATLPIAMSTCEFMRYTGATLGPAGIPGDAVDPPDGAWPGYGGSGQPSFPPPYSGWPNKVKQEQYVMTHSDKSADCAYQGKDTAGGFGWLSSTNCLATIDVDSTGNHYWANIDTGNNVPNSCKNVLDALHGTVLDVPIFDCLVRNNGGAPTGGPASQTSCSPGSAGGSQTWYHLAGFAKFYLSGNKLTNSTAQNSLVNNVMPCSPSSPNPGGANPWSGNAGRCISGWFVSGELTSPSIGLGGPAGGNFGTYTVLPAG